jgi:hypothetical protein
LRSMNEEGIELLKKLISQLEGAPFPHTVSAELYEIWYDHTRDAVSDALGYLNRIGAIDPDTNVAEFRVEEE